MLIDRVTVVVWFVAALVVVAGWYAVAEGIEWLWRLYA